MIHNHVALHCKKHHAPQEKRRALALWSSLYQPWPFTFNRHVYHELEQRLHHLGLPEMEIVRASFMDRPSDAASEHWQSQQTRWSRSTCPPEDKHEPAGGQLNGEHTVGCKMKHSSSPSPCLRTFRCRWTRRHRDHTLLVVDLAEPKAP